MKQRTVERWPTTSHQLLEALRDRQNSEAWERFAGQYSAIVRRFSCRRGLQYADAEDIAQKVLIEVSRQIDKFEYHSERGRFRSWLATIAVRAIWRVQRRQAAGRELSLEELDELQHPGDEAWMPEFNTAVLEVGLERIRGEFSADEWEAFQRNWLLGEPASAIAAAMGKKLGWVYQTKYRALDRLKQQIGILSADFPDGST